MIKNLLLIIALFLFSTEITQAQKTNITGTITDAANKEPMPGVSVRVKGGSQGTSTNAKGQFSIAAAAADELIISYTGYKPLTLAVSGRTKIDVTLVSDVAQLNEVVLIGTRSAGAGKVRNCCAC